MAAQADTQDEVSRHCDETRCASPLAVLDLTVYLLSRAPRAVRNFAEATPRPRPRRPDPAGREPRARHWPAAHRGASGPAPRFGKEHRESARRPGVAGVFVLVLVPATTGTAARPAHPRHSTAPQFELHTPRTPRPAEHVPLRPTPWCCIVHGARHRVRCRPGPDTRRYGTVFETTVLPG